MPSLATKAAIKRASQKARENAKRLDKTALSDLLEIYRRASFELQEKILRYGSPGTQSLRIESMQLLLQEVSTTMDELSRIQKTALFERMAEVAAMGIEPIAEIAGALRVAEMVDEAVMAARNFIAADGLQLSDRLWRVNRHAKEAVSSAIENAIVQGMSASEAAEDFVRRGQPIPASISKKMSIASAGRVASIASRSLMTDDSAAYQQAKRVFRTEINRAHGTAYLNSLKEIDGVAGSKYLLGLNHPRPDICDMHSRVNLHGLGPGVYPLGRTPWPAHPNTLSYVVVVFEDEVSLTDKAKKQTRIEWLKSSPKNLQVSVLNSRMKQRALMQGALRENQIATPWKVLKKRYSRQSITIDIESAVGPSILPQANKLRALPSSRNPFIGRKLQSQSRKNLIVESIKNYSNVVDLGGRGGTVPVLNSIANALHVVLGRYNVRINRMGFIGRSGRFRNANGVYFFPPRAHIELRPGYFKDQFDTSSHLAYLVGRQRRIESLKMRISGVDPASLTHRTLTENMRRIEASERFSFSSIAEDGVFSTTAHEAGHALYYQGANMQRKFADNLSKHGVTQLDWYRVSEYAGTNESELFAELTTAFAQGLERSVPDNIANAYLDTVEAFELNIKLSETYYVAI